jgi:hypothetical protein
VRKIEFGPVFEATWRESIIEIILLNGALYSYRCRRFQTVSHHKSVWYGYADGWMA